MLAFFATIDPGPTSINNIAKNISLDNKTVQNYINILCESSLLTRITKKKTGGRLLRATEKVYLNNPNFYYAISNQLGLEVKLGTIREIFMVNMFQNSGNTVFFSDKGAFQVNGYIFEVGGKNKSRKQIKDIQIKSSLNYESLISYFLEISVRSFSFLTSKITVACEIACRKLENIKNNIRKLRIKRNFQFE